MIICASIFDQDYAQLAERTLFVNRKMYCVENNYPQIIKKYVDKKAKDTFSSVGEIGFEKIKFILSLLERYEYVWFSDCDAMVMNMKIRIESLIEKYPFDMIVGNDFNGPNCGSMIIKNTDRIKDYFYTMLGRRDGYFHEQDYIWKNPADFIVAVPQRVMNSYDYSLYLGHENDPGNYQPGDFFMHWPAQTNAQRLLLYEKWKGSVIA